MQVHPAVFSSAEVSGSLSVWDLTCSTEVPVASCSPEGVDALNKVEGRRTIRGIRQDKREELEENEDM